MHRIIALTAFLASTAIVAQPAVHPAPHGNPVIIAQEVIGSNFGVEICPRVARARRLSDGTIVAYCTNRESFRVFGMVVADELTAVALRCSAAAAFGIGGCE